MTFEEILQEYNIPIADDDHHHARDGWIQFDCPFCGVDSQSYHMGYSIEGTFCNCWKCGFKPLIKTLQQLTDQDFNTIKKLLDDLDAVKVRKTKRSGKLRLPKPLGPLQPIHQRYLRRRNFDDMRLVSLWNIQGIGLAARLAWRIYIPAHLHGKVVSWTTRTVNPDVKNKYSNAPPTDEDVPLKSLLYGEDYIRGSTLFVCEGPTDVWRVGPGAVCTFGTGYTQAQFNRMIKYPRVVVCFDKESEAQRRANILLDDLSPFCDETINLVLKESDPGNASRRTVKEIREQWM